MADKFSGYVNSDFTGPKGVVGNFRHAERIFVDNFYRLSPRTKFLYYIVFGGADREISFLVKSSDLPKFSFDTATKNVYNRTKHVYKKIQYDALNIVFHDDNQGLAHAMFNSYYKHYCSDGTSAGQGLHPMATVAYDAAYGLSFTTPVNYFSRISLYTLSRQRFTGYELLAPRIKSWTHGGVEASSNEPAENNMTIDYEGVVYSTGTVSYGNPDGFASLAYDYVGSPLRVGGNAAGDNLGRDEIFEDYTDKNLLQQPGGYTDIAVQTINTYSGVQSNAVPNYSGIVGEFRNPANISENTNTVSGVLGAAFPKASGLVDSASKIVARPKILQTIQGSTFGQPSGTPNERPPTFDPGRGF